MKYPFPPITVVVLLMASVAFGAETKPTDSQLTLMKWKIDGVPREALVFISKSANGSETSAMKMIVTSGLLMRC